MSRVKDGWIPSKHWEDGTRWDLYRNGDFVGRVVKYTGDDYWSATSMTAPYCDTVHATIRFAARSVEAL
jgi:hypothetical protein